MAHDAQPTLAVWKFASCDGCQLSLLDCEDELLARGRRGRDRLFPGSDARRRGKARTTCRWSKARSPPRTTPSASRRCGATSSTPGHDRRLRDRRRHPGAAQLRGRAGFTRVVYARPEYIETLATSTPIADHVAGRLRAARLPDQQAPAARGDHAPSWPAASPTIAAAQRLRRVQAARHGLRAWSRTGRPASARSPMPAAAPSARPTTAAATAASGRWRRRTPRRSPASCAAHGRDRARL